MANYIIGLDFGTYQTKVSINHLDKSPQKHEFFEFENGKEKSFFLPSKVFLLKNGLIDYGDSNNENIKNEFNYFKIASAEDKEFRVLSDLAKPIYTYSNNYHGYSPEFISVLYLTFVQLLIKEKYNKGNKSGANNIVSGIFSNLRRRISGENDFRIRLGIPTEYSKKANHIRRRKFETILLISDLLQKKLKNSLSDFLSKNIDELTSIVININDKVPKDEQLFEKTLLDNQLSVFPESAAGLLYFVKSGKLLKGKLYAAIDIGGGTSDLSFFNVLPDGKIEYLSSESYLNACNNIYLNCNGKSETLEDLKKVEQKILESIDNGKWESNKKYTSAVADIKEKLSHRLKKLIKITFDGGLAKFTIPQILKTLKEQPIIIYGGGLSHPQINSWRDVFLFNCGGGSIGNNGNQTYMDIQDINLYKPTDSLILNKKWQKDFPLLIVAFGLSYLNHIDDSYWIDEDYRSLKLSEILTEVPHPFNEGMYIYKVVEGRWE